MKRVGSVSQSGPMSLERLGEPGSWVRDSDWREFLPCFGRLGLRQGFFDFASRFATLTGLLRSE
jgi:hypothetical protein